MLYNCGHCSGTFKVKHALYTHLLIHTGVKEHSCSKCCKQFTQQSTLDSHMKSVHLKIKSYKCYVCTSAFSTSTALQFHLLTHDKKSSYPCLACPAVFGTKVELTRHLDSLKHAGMKHFCTKGL